MRLVVIKNWSLDGARYRGAAEWKQPKSHECKASFKDVFYRDAIAPTALQWDRQSGEPHSFGNSGIYCLWSTRRHSVYSWYRFSRQFDPRLPLILQSSEDDFRLKALRIGTKDEKFEGTETYDT